MCLSVHFSLGKFFLVWSQILNTAWAASWKNWLIACSENKGANQLRGNGEADQCFCFSYMDSIIPLLANSEISNFQPSSLFVQPGLCRSWTEIPKTTFLTTWLIYWQTRVSSWLIIQVQSGPLFCDRHILFCFFSRKVHIQNYKGT